MKPITIYASDHCFGWEELLESVEVLREEYDLDITIKDPIEHEEEFYGLGLVVCPSVLYGDELVAVGIPEPDQFYQELRRKSESNEDQSHKDSAESSSSQVK